jgi:hypothetical protein
VERAADWIFSHLDELNSVPMEVDAPAAQVHTLRAHTHTLSLCSVSVSLLMCSLCVPYTLRPPLLLRTLTYPTAPDVRSSLFFLSFTFSLSLRGRELNDNRLQVVRIHHPCGQLHHERPLRLPHP